MLDKAFEYRKKRDYPKALECLNKACDEEKNGRACFVKAQAYSRGGWGLLKDRTQYDYYLSLGISYAPCMVLFRTELNDEIRSNPFARVLYDVLDCEDDEKSIETLIKCIQDDGLIEAIPFLIKMDDIDDTARDYWLKVGAEWGDAECMYQLGDYEGAAKQRHAAASYHFAEICYKQNLCKLGAKYLLQSRLPDCIMDQKMTGRFIPLEEHFIYGRAIACDPLYRDRYQISWASEYVKLYQDTVKHVKNAIDMFNLCCKTTLSKDTRWLISKKIWESREDAEIWQLRKNENSWCILF
jgi:hypothetical protein